MCAMEDEVPQRLTHLSGDGDARMVDVTDKDISERVAVAVGSIRMSDQALAAVIEGNGKKGEVLGVARLAGIMAGKKTADLIPLCHPLPETSFEVNVVPVPEEGSVRVEATARVRGRTGVEMEALTAASVALLTVYDMVKAIDRGMRIEQVRLVRKEGGRSGVWTAGDPTG